MVSTFSAKSLPNQKNEAMEHAGTLKMEARAVANGPPSRQTDSRELRDEAQGRQDEPSECPNGCPKGPWQPNLLLQVLPKANLSAPGSLQDRFWSPGAPIWEDLASMLSKQFHSIPFHSMHTIPFHSIPFHSIPIYSIPFHSIPFHSIHSVPFHSISVPLIPCHSCPFHSK